VSIWYCVRSATRQETKTLARLTEKGYAVFLPCETVQRRLGGADERVHRPLFPGYMFILCEPDNHPEILEMEGVHQFVRVGTGENLRPFPWPSSVIIGLQAQERAGDFDRTRAKPPPAYKPRKGDKVQVTAGHWHSYIGTVLNTPTKARALVKIEGPFGKGVTLDVAHLKAA
jgi:transcription antitermination factor NusG